MALLGFFPVTPELVPDDFPWEDDPQFDDEPEFDEDDLDLDDDEAFDDAPEYETQNEAW